MLNDKTFILQKSIYRITVLCRRIIRVIVTGHNQVGRVVIETEKIRCSLVELYFGRSKQGQSGVGIIIIFALISNLSNKPRKGK